MRLVCIVGAGRSGTNLFAHAFEAEGPHCVNLVENRYVWSYGQRRTGSDAREADEATPAVARYIRRHFARHDGAGRILIDKTPSNALRIPFVAAVFPDVKIINIVRDGRDNLVSRSRQWQGRHKGEAAGAPTLRHRARLMRERCGHLKTLIGRGNLPLDRVPAVIADVAPALALHVLTGSPHRYGERVPGLAAVRRWHGLDAAAAAQWRDVTMAAHVAGRRLGPDRYREVGFEALLADPSAVWRSIMTFVGAPETGDGAAYLATTIRHGAVGTWQDDPAATARIQAVEGYLRPTLEYFGYAWR